MKVFMIACLILISIGISCAFQYSTTEPPSPPPGLPTVQDVEAVCPAACFQYDFTVCRTAVMMAIPVGEMISTSGTCYQKCHELVEIFNTMPDMLDTSCLAAADTCRGVSKCLGVEIAQSTDVDTETEICIEQPRPAPDPERARLIGQLAAGMRRVVARRDRGNWYRCGEKLSPAAQVEESVLIAWKLVEEMEATGLGDTVSPWGVLGTMYNESGFDPCALGVYPRKWAYQEGLLSPRRQTRSHAREEVLAAIESPDAKKRFATTGFDLGLCQVLSRFYRDMDKADLLTVAGGVRVCVLEMQARAQHGKTRHPWALWRGTETAWYSAKVNRWVRIMQGSRT